MMNRGTAGMHGEIEISSKMLSSLIKALYEERRRLNQYNNINGHS